MAVTSERGQMLLIGALVLAVLFISLSFVLDGSIQTTTVSGEASAEVSVSETVALQNSIRRDVGVIIDSAIHENPSNPGSFPCSPGTQSQVCSVEYNVSALNENHREYYARQDRIVVLSLVDVSMGNWIHQDTPDDFMYDQDGDGSEETAWDLTATGSHISNFTIQADGVTATSSEPFVIDISNGGTTKSIEIYDAGGNAEIRVDGQTCALSLPIRIDLMSAEVGGNHCDPLDFFGSLGSPYTVSYEDADKITGTYNVVISGSGNGPNVDDRLYYVDVNLAERSSATDYESTIRVAPPGEP